MYPATNCAISVATDPSVFSITPFSKGDALCVVRSGTPKKRQEARKLCELNTLP
ncbi:hypothetical protein N7U49_01885 [Streptomyces sp. AD2-2]|nr:hypothetical protein N7U49_01885 [Streptomyces sp. AD2-2]